MDREAWQATVHGVTKSQTGLSDLGCTCMQNQEVWRWSPTHPATPCPHPRGRGHLPGASVAWWGGTVSLKVFTAQGRPATGQLFKHFNRKGSGIVLLRGKECRRGGNSPSPSPL